MASLSKGVDSWVLMAFIFKDLDDCDYKNARILAERLFAIDNNCEDFRHLYAKCHFVLRDYNAAYDLLKGTTSIPCRHLFALCCLELGNLTDKTDKYIFYWRSGIQALQEAITDYSKLEIKHNLADDLTCVASRSHMPSKASLRNLLGELYNKMDNTYGSVQQYLQCLDENPFKLTAYINTCNIAPDTGLPDSDISPGNLFKEFDLQTTSLERSTNFNLPHVSSPSNSKSPISHTKTFASDASIPPPSPHEKQPRLDQLMPTIRSSYNDVTADQFRALVAKYLQTNAEMPSWNDEPERTDIEKNKDSILDFVANDIERQKAEEAFKNKHGLHKKPPTEVVQDMTVDQIDDNEEIMDDDSEFVDPKLPSPPRFDSSSRSDTYQSYNTPGLPSTIKNRLRTKRSAEQMNDSIRKTSRITSTFKTSDRTTQPSTKSIDSYFIPWVSPTSPSGNQEPSLNKRPSLGKTTTGTIAGELTSKAAKDATEQTIIDAMNRILGIILIIANAHDYQSHYYCRETLLELQKLDNSQYDTPSVLCLMGRAFYDAGDHAAARMFYRRSSFIAPWFCEGIPLYSTCLWYLEKEGELCLLAKLTKENASHQYEAYIAAGNWTKCTNRGNEAVRWFQKAVDLDPRRSYGHALLGYEEWEKGNCLGAKQHFNQCMITNKQSYFGWHGSATAYQGMAEFPQARRLMEEAIRLHPRHPVLLGSMAEILLSMKEYELAYIYVEKSLAIRDNISNQELKKKIRRRLDLGDTDTSID